MIECVDVGGYVVGVSVCVRWYVGYVVMYVGTYVGCGSSVPRSPSFPIYTNIIWLGSYVNTLVCVRKCMYYVFQHYRFP